MKQDVVIIGSEHHALMVASVLELSGSQVYGYLDDFKETGTKVAGKRVLGPVTDDRLIRSLTRRCKFILGISNAHMNLRRRISERLTHLGCRWASAIHPSCILSREATISDGCFLGPGVIINRDAVLGLHCVAYSGAIIEHNCRLGPNVWLSPAVALSGNCTIERDVFIGTSAVAINDIHIAEAAVVGAGAVVIRNIACGTTVVGVPAQALRRIRPKKRGRDEKKLGFPDSSHR